MIELDLNFIINHHGSYMAGPGFELATPGFAVRRDFRLDGEIIMTPRNCLPSVKGERGGSVVECRTPEREVRGSKPNAAVLCP